MRETERERERRETESVRTCGEKKRARGRVPTAWFRFGFGLVGAAFTGMVPAVAVGSGSRQWQ